jgi:hypothetical protein
MASVMAKGYIESGVSKPMVVAEQGSKKLRAGQRGMQGQLKGSSGTAKRGSKGFQGSTSVLGR